VEYLGARGSRIEPRAVPPPSVVDRPLAAAPVGVDRSLPPARPVADLLREFGITSLKQAGAVRARRQISFAEYMALKRHFESGPPPGTTGSAGAPG
jgi:hypothetical protein